MFYSPRVGNGCNLALQDAATLADCVAKHGRNIPDALAEYSKLRRRPVKFYQWASANINPLFQSSVPLVHLPRDYGMGPASAWVHITTLFASLFGCMPSVCCICIVVVFYVAAHSFSFSMQIPWLRRQQELSLAGVKMGFFCEAKPDPLQAFLTTCRDLLHLAEA